MTNQHFDRTLHAFLTRIPFRPFTIAMDNGDRVVVDDAKALAFRDGLAVFIAENGTPTIFDHENVSALTEA
jgi:hypothetical protein